MQSEHGEHPEPSGEGAVEALAVRGIVADVGWGQAARVVGLDPRLDAEARHPILRHGRWPELA